MKPSVPFLSTEVSTVKELREKKEKIWTQPCWEVLGPPGSFMHIWRRGFQVLLGYGNTKEHN